MSLSNLKVGTRLGLGFGLLIVIMLGVAAFGTFLSARQMAAMSQALDVDMRYAMHVLETRTAIANLRRYEKDVLLSIGARERVEGYMKLWRGQIKEAAGELKAAGALATGAAERASVAGLEEVVTRYERNMEILQAGIVTGEIASAEQGYRLIAGFSETVRAADAKLEEMHAATLRGVEEVKASLVQREKQRRLIVGSAVFVVIGLAALIAVLIARSIVRPLGHAVELAEALAQGDLTRRLKSLRADEVGQLMRALDDVVVHQARIVRAIQETSDTVSSAACEIAQGNTDLSARTEQQASALEETSASMQQMTATVGQNAENAEKANQLALAASGVAARGGDVVREAVATMNGITESSRKIADIIGVIDGIAFQTNILALNAAVEAARAGEQGRGFAVVASEVRSLAQRSAGAAKEIKHLITESVAKVDAGARQVNGAGATMEEIVASVKKVGALVAEISAASREQAQGIEQVAETMTQLEQVTQQNAAMVEEASAAAGTLEEQSRSLAGAVGAFRLEQRAPAIAAPRPSHATPVALKLAA